MRMEKFKYRQIVYSCRRIKVFNIRWISTIGTILLFHVMLLFNEVKKGLNRMAVVRQIVDWYLFSSVPQMAKFLQTDEILLMKLIPTFQDK